MYPRIPWEVVAEPLESVGIPLGTTAVVNPWLYSMAAFASYSIAANIRKGDRQ